VRLHPTVPFLRHHPWASVRYLGNAAAEFNDQNQYAGRFKGFRENVEVLY
jgi:hypothetical protein